MLKPRGLDRVLETNKRERTGLWTRLWTRLRTTSSFSGFCTFSRNLTLFVKTSLKRGQEITNCSDTTSDTTSDHMTTTSDHMTTSSDHMTTSSDPTETLLRPYWDQILEMRKMPYFLGEYWPGPIPRGATRVRTTRHHPLPPGTPTPAHCLVYVVYGYTAALRGLSEAHRAGLRNSVRPKTAFCLKTVIFILRNGPVKTALFCKNPYSFLLWFAKNPIFALFDEKHPFWTLF